MTRPHRERRREGSRLQWSRDPEIAVTANYATWRLAAELASMEPRSGDRGDTARRKS